MQGLARASTQGVAAALLGVAVLQALVALTATTPAATAANAVGAAVGVIAYYHYELMRRAPSVGARMELRFSDWAITCPLLLVELSKLTSQGAAVDSLLASRSSSACSGPGGSRAGRWPPLTSAIRLVVRTVRIPDPRLRRRRASSAARGGLLCRVGVVSDRVLAKRCCDAQRARSGVEGRLRSARHRLIHNKMRCGWSAQPRTCAI